MGITVFSFFTHELARAGTCIYQVRPGETLSEIAQTRLGRPVYAKKTGSLLRLLELNPHLLNPNQLLAGELVFLSADDSIHACSGLPLRQDESIPISNDKPPTQSAQVKPTPPVAIEPPPSEVAAVAPQAMTPALPAPIDPPPSAVAPIAPNRSPAASESTENFGTVEVRAGTFFTKVSGSQNSNGSRANLLSNLAKFYDLYWRQTWGPQFRTYLNLGSQSISFIESPTRIIENRSGSYAHYGAGADFFLSDRVFIGIEAGERQELFYYATSATNVKIDGVAIPHVDLKLNGILISAPRFSLGAEVSYAYLAGASASTFRVKPGRGYRGELFIIQALSPGKLELRGGLFHSRRDQATDDLKVNRTDRGLSLGLGLNF